MNLPAEATCNYGWDIFLAEDGHRLLHLNRVVNLLRRKRQQSLCIFEITQQLHKMRSVEIKHVPQSSYQPMSILLMEAVWCYLSRYSGSDCLFRF